MVIGQGRAVTSLMRSFLGQSFLKTYSRHLPFLRSSLTLISLVN